jgi:hypothetical protein
MFNFFAKVTFGMEMSKATNNYYKEESLLKNSVAAE